MIRAPKAPVEPFQYLDSGAFHHIIVNPTNLTFAQPYTSPNQLIVGNGNGVPISQFGNSSYYSHDHCKRPLFLQNIFHVSSIAKNQLNVT